MLQHYRLMHMHHHGIIGNGEDYEQQQEIFVIDHISISVLDTDTAENREKMMMNWFMIVSRIWFGDSGLVQRDVETVGQH